MARRSGEGIRVGIVNPMTFVGKEVKAILHDRGIPYSRIDLIDTTGQSAGALTEVDDEAVVVTAASDEVFEDLDLVFFCGSATANAPWIAKRDQSDYVAVDLSQPSSVSTEGAAVVAGVNLKDVDDETRLIISPHPIVIPITLVLNQISSRAPLKLAAVSVIQPASELDQPGVDELLEQIIRVLNVESFPKEIFQRQLAFNLFPAAHAAQSERYAAQQVRTILGGDLPITIALTQGGVFHGHSFSMFIQTVEDLDQSELIAALRENDAIRVAEPDENFGTIDAGGTDQVLIGRVSKDDQGVWIWAVVDNLRRASALNGVLAAETLMARGGVRH